MDGQAKAASRKPQRPERDILIALLRGERLLQAGDVAGAEREARRALEADSARPEAHHLLGESARHAGRHDAAERHLRRAIQSNPRIAYFHHSLGNALQDQGKLDAAIDAYRRALRLSPQAPELWNDLGTAYFASGAAERAADCYRNAVRHGPRHVVALANLGASLRAAGDLRGAIQAYRRELWQRVRGAFSRRQKRTNELPATAGELTAEAQRWLERGNDGFAEALVDWALHQDAGDGEALCLKAALLQRQGKACAAVELLAQGSAMGPARHRLGAARGRALRAAGMHDLAAQAFRDAMAGSLKDPDLTRELALCYAATGDRKEAIALLQALARQTDAVPVWSLLGRLSIDDDDEPGGLQALEHALARDPYSASALAQLARLRVRQQKAAEAIIVARTAVERDPLCIDAHFWLGRALGLAGLWDEACEAFREATDLDPGDIEPIRWLGIALRAAGQVQASESLLQDALREHPGHPELTSELAVSVFEHGDVARARTLLDTVLQAKPDDVDALAAMCHILGAEGRPAEGQAFARRALAISPHHISANHNLGLSMLQLGNYGEGWERYEWRKNLTTHASAYLRFPYREWDGSDLQGKTVLVYAEQGLGDEIMFASCLPELAARAGRVVVECDERLSALFKRSFPQCLVFGRKRTLANAWTESLDPQPHFQLPLGSLPRHFRRQPEAFPAHSGYLKADPAKIQSWRNRLAALGKGRKLGISWRGGIAKTGRARRSLDAAQLASVLHLEGIQLVSLQYGNVEDELAGLERLHRTRVFHAKEAIEDYDEGAALVCALDGVVTVCTALVHLTGALGRPALVMAPFSAEWRYGMSGENMAWYPSVRVFRQSVAGEWTPVLAAVRTQLEGGGGKT